MSSIEEISEKIASLKFIVVAGNGGSASIASHFSSDLCKLGILAYCFNDNISTVTALTNDYGWDDLYIQQYKNLPFKPQAILIFSVHGGEYKNHVLWSKNLVDLAQQAKHDKISILTITGNEGGLLRIISDLNINVWSSDTSEVEGEHGKIAHKITDAIKGYKDNNMYHWTISTTAEAFRVDD